MKYTIVNTNAKKAIAFFPGKKGKGIRMEREFPAIGFNGIYFDTPLTGWDLNDFSKVAGVLNFYNCKSVLGISNGAVLGLELLANGLVSECLSISGALREDTEVLPKEIKLTMINGMTDKSVPFCGGFVHGVQLLGAVDTLDRFKPVTGVVENLDIIQYGESPVVLYALKQVGHDALPSAKKLLNMKQVFNSCFL